MTIFQTVYDKSFTRKDSSVYCGTGNGTTRVRRPLDFDKTICELALENMYWDAECKDMVDDFDVLCVLLRCLLYQSCRNCSLLNM
jgi:hypothetical protein